MISGRQRRIRLEAPCATCRVFLAGAAAHQALTPLRAASEEVREEGEFATAYDVEALARLLFSRERRMRRRS